MSINFIFCGNFRNMYPLSLSHSFQFFEFELNELNDGTFFVTHLEITGSTGLRDVKVRCNPTGALINDFFTGLGERGMK